MSSFGDGNNKTKIEEALSWIAQQDYADDFDTNDSAQRQFVLDVLDVLRYICNEI